MKKILSVRLSLLLIFAAFAVCCCACRKETAQETTAEQTEEKEAKTEKSDSILLYYLNADEDGFEKVTYTLKNPNDPKEAAKEVLLALSDTENNNTDEYKPSVFEEAAVNDISIEEKNLTIDFGTGYNQLDNVKEALMRTAIVKTVLQIKGVESVTFYVNGKSLQEADSGGDTVLQEADSKDMAGIEVTDSEENSDTAAEGSNSSPVGVMDEKSILTDDSDASVYESKKKVKLYYTDQDGKKLIACERTIETKDNVPLETQVLLALKKAPASKKNLRSPLPENFEVNQTQVFNNVCYVDLGEDIENPAVNVKEKVTVYAMVNTLTELNRAYQVQFTVEGKNISELNEFKNFGSLLSGDYSLCK